MSVRVDRSLLIRSLAGLLGLAAVVVAAGVWLRAPIEAMAEVFIGRGGLPGLFAAVVFTDASPIPMTHEPVLLLAVAQGIDPTIIGAVASAASVAAGPVGWTGGRILGRSRWAVAWSSGRGAEMVAFLGRWGATGVAIAALLPIPYALATWTAGLVGVPFGRLLAASLLRIPKTWFYLGLVVAGWRLGA